jgi:WD40 repeat protein
MRLLLLSLLVVSSSFACRSAALPPDPKYKLIPQTPPATAVNSVAVSPDGSLIATAAGEGGVRLYDASSGRLLRVFGDIGDRCVVFSPDGKALTAAGFHMDKLVALWDVRSGRRLRTFVGQTEWEADATAISPDGKLLASVATDKQILVWETATGTLKLRLTDQPARVAALAFSPDGTTLAGAGGDKTIRLWDCATGQLRKTLTGHGAWICTLAFSPDGRTIASGACDWGFHRGHDWPRSPDRGPEQFEWRLWDIAPAKPLRTERGPGRLLSLAISPDGRSLACGVGKDVRLYDLASNAPPKIAATHAADVTSVAFAPDGRAIVSGSHDQTVQFTRLDTGAVAWRAPGSFDQVNSVALSRDGALLVTGSGDGRFARGWPKLAPNEWGPGAVRLWDARTGRMLRRLGDPAEQVLAVAVSPDGTRIAAGGATTTGKAAVHIRDAATGRTIWSYTSDDREVLAIAFAPDGSSLASGNAAGAVTIRDAKTGSLTRTLPGHAGGATAVLFSPDGSRLYAGQAQGGTRIWDAHTGTLLQTCPAQPSRPSSFTVDRLVNSIALTADGNTLAMCGSSVNGEFVGPLLLCDARTGAVRRDFTAENIHGRPMALSPDGAIVATGGKSVQLWDARTGKPIRQLLGYLKRTQSITFSADGKLIVAGGSYGTTNLWDVATGRHLATLFAFSDPATGAATDDWLACTPDGFYDGSPNVDKFLAWRVGDALETSATLAPELHHPDRVTASLRIPASQWEGEAPSEPRVPRGAERANHAAPVD